MTAYEIAAAQVGFLTEDELKSLEEKIALALTPCPPRITDEELDQMEAEHLHFLATRQQGIAYVNPHLAEARG